MSSDKRDIRKSEPKLIVCALQFKYVDPLGVSKYFVIELLAAVYLDDVIEACLGASLSFISDWVYVSNSCTHTPGIGLII